MSRIRTLTLEKCFLSFRPISDRYATLCLSVGEEYEDDVTRCLLNTDDVTKSRTDDHSVGNGPVEDESVNEIKISDTNFLT